MKTYCRVITFSYSFDFQGITFGVPENIEVKKGTIVEIKIGEKNPELAIVGEVFFQENISNGEYEIKDVLRVIDKVSVSNIHLELIFWMSRYYFCSLHSCGQLLFPSHLVKTLQKGKIKIPTIENISYIKKPLSALSIHQDRIYQEITDTKEKKILLWGVTGSGKTEIYMHYCQELLKKGKQILLLTPEIILGNQLANRYKKVFGEDIILEIHSAISDAKKTKIWMEIYYQIPKIIIGTRSSLFYPYSNLGAIIIDEEHDKSYLSENGPRYNTIEVASFLQKKFDIPLILASATPRVKTMFEAQKGEYELLQLFEKFEKI